MKIFNNGPARPHTSSQSSGEISRSSFLDVEPVNKTKI